MLNSHRKFLLSYAAPVVWNVAIVSRRSSLFGRTGKAEHLVIIAAWGAVAGSMLQVAVQLPATFAVGGRIVPAMWNRVPELRGVVTAFIPNADPRAKPN